MTSPPERYPIEAAELALDMMGQAFEALAMLYELRHPGEYSAQAQKLKEYVADQFRHKERSLASDGSDRAAFRESVLRVRDLFERVDRQVCDLRPAAETKAA